jgi:hypothetical protein
LIAEPVHHDQKFEVGSHAHSAPACPERFAHGARCAKADRSNLLDGSPLCKQCKDLSMRRRKMNQHSEDNAEKMRNGL